MADVREFKKGNWQTFGTVWEDKTVVVADADWANDNSPVVMAAVMKAETTVGKLRKQLELPRGTDIETAKALAYPQLLYLVARLAEGDEDAQKQYGIMIGASIRDAARRLRPISRDLDEIYRAEFDRARTEKV
jgi:hypothetical protein